MDPETWITNIKLNQSPKDHREIDLSTQEGQDPKTGSFVSNTLYWEQLLVAGILGLLNS